LRKRTGRSDGVLVLSGYDVDPLRSRRVIPPPVPRPAATVVLLRPGPDGPEVLLTQRPATMAFAADMHVFPGGAVDPADADDATAAIRELFEEAGVLIADARTSWPTRDEVARARAALLDGSASIAQVAEMLDVELRPDRLAPLSRWVTPPFVDRRFDVRFFAAELPLGAVPSFLGGEVVAHRWMTPRAALAERAAGLIGLWVPTSATLQQLEHVRSFETLRRRLGPLSGREELRVVDELPGVVRVVLPGAGGVEGQSVNAYLVGERQLLAVDPGDPSDEAAETLLELARTRSGAIDGIVITHADPDHAAGAEALAGRIRVPIYGGPGSGSDLPYDVVELREGDPVPAGDIELRALETPGHRADHIALAADGFMLAGDLVGPGPSRSILGPPDTTAWLESLDRLAALSPERVLPGHGDPPGDITAAIAESRTRLGARPSRLEVPRRRSG
jgi:glyoxylase-like metal-dependent hydrolase (beta-lactamase superfamily II)/8-oxo-dGTP pyrophosphatase MutT (NUDIX family)